MYALLFLHVISTAITFYTCRYSKDNVRLPTNDSHSYGSARYVAHCQMPYYLSMNLYVQ